MARILVVDDSETDRILVGGLIERQKDLTVAYAGDGAEAIAAMADHLPDLVLTDLMMPDMDGLELLAEVRRRHELVPVILMTARGNQELAVRALRAGAASYIPKSVLGRDLVDTVYSVLEVSHENRNQALLMHSMKRSESVFTLGADSSLIGPLVNYLQQNLSAMGACSETETTRVGVALEEALTNALHHGNLEVESALRRDDLAAYHRLVAERSQQPPYCERSIHVAATLDRKQAVFVVRDEGPGFNPESLPDPTDAANLARPHGRGILLMRTFMDEVRYNTRGNEVTLIKRCRTHDDEQEPADA